MTYGIGRGLLRPVISDEVLEGMRLEASLTAKQRIDLDKIRRAPSPHHYDFEKWVAWTGNNYIKSWYDIQLADGTILQHFWPNAGKLVGQGREYTDADNVKVRLSENSPFA